MAAKLEEKPHKIRCLRAIEAYFGGRQYLSDKIGYSEYQITSWHRRGNIPDKACMKLSKLIGGRFAIEELKN